MSGGARRAETVARPPLQQWGGVAAVVAILALIGGLLLFGDRILGGDADSLDPEQAAAAAKVKEETEEEVVVAATEVLTTWSRPELGYAAWWKGLKPLLTPGGRQAYAFTDPSQVPLLVDVRADKIVLNPSGATATVWFQTTIGEYGIDLSRKGATGKWRANRVVFPGQKSMFQ